MSSTPTRLGRYELREVLGRGAMGTVYRAYDSVLERTLAVKTYHPYLASRESVRLRFEREVKTTSKLGHPNIVVVYDGGFEGEQPFIAMELVEGPTLDELLSRGRLPLEEATRILLAVCDAIAYAHGQGVIHRDLKPANILMAQNRHPKISDFGLAKVADSASGGLTTAPIGTPTFMAPEQILGQPTGRRADVFALGVLAYLMLTGKRPFTNESVPAAMYAIVHGTPPPASDVAPDLPRAVDAFFARALAKRPEERTPDVVAFASELVAALRPRLTARAPVERRWSGRAMGAAAVPAVAVLGWLMVQAPELVPPPAVQPATAEADEHVGTSAAAIVPSAVAPGGAAYAVEMAAPEVPAMDAPVAEIPAADAQVADAPLAEAPAAEALAAEAPTAEAPAAEAPMQLASVPPAPPPAAKPAERSERKRLRDVPVPVAAAGSASIEVASVPPGAEITVDGRWRGRTPQRVTGLGAGSHRVVVEKAGYAPSERTMNLAGNSNHQLALALLPSSAALSIVSDPPGAEVHLNGESRGRTPVRIGDLAAGAHDISVSIPGHEPYHKRMSFKPGERRELRVGVER